MWSFAGFNPWDCSGLLLQLHKLTAGSMRPPVLVTFWPPSSVCSPRDRILNSLGWNPRRRKRVALISRSWLLPLHHSTSLDCSGGGSLKSHVSLLVTAHCWLLAGGWMVSAVLLVRDCRGHAATPRPGPASPWPESGLGEPVERQRPGPSQRPVNTGAGGQGPVFISITSLGGFFWCMWCGYIKSQLQPKSLLQQIEFYQNILWRRYLIGIQMYFTQWRSMKVSNNFSG